MSINENEGSAEGLKDFFGFKNAYIKGHFSTHAFAPAGRISGGQHTQSVDYRLPPPRSVALGYVLAGPSARSSNAC